MRRAGTARIVGVAILSVTLLSGCGGAPHAARATTDTSSERASVSADTLARVVLQPGEAPTGTTYVKSQSGPQSIEQLLHSGSGVHEAQQQLRRTGFQKAYRALFVGTATTGPGSDQRSVASFAVTFPSPDAARHGQRVLDASLQKGRKDVSPLPTPGLGPDAHGVQAPLLTLGGATYYYSWVKGSSVLMLLDAGGGAATSAGTSLATAHEIVRQASTAAAGDAAALVLPVDSAPTGTTLVQAKSGPKPVSGFGSGATGSRLRALRARAAYLNLFQTTALRKKNGTQPASPRSNVVSSQAQAYDTVAHASAAYRLLVARERKLFEGHPVTAAPSNGLGAEATGFRYVDKKPGRDVVGIAYYWREANAVYILTVVGDPVFSTAEKARALARHMGS